MKQQHDSADWSILHSPEDMQQLSNLGHRIEGSLLLIVAVIALLQAAGFLKFKQLWPLIIIIAGVFLTSFLLLHHGVKNFKLVWNLIMADAQQRQHLVMAGLLIIAGASELMFRAYNISWLRFVWPIALGVIGIMFLIHEQHGSDDAVAWAQTIHKYLGILLLLVSLAVVANILFGERYHSLRFIWPILLILTSIFLFAYKEPEGAYQDNAPSHGTHSDH
jgi:hypothetical protein